MEARGIRTDKGEFNRWVKATNALIGKLKKKITALLDWLKEAHEELNKPQAPNLAQLLSEYYTNRSAGAWSRKAKIGNLKEFNEICNYLMQNNLTTPEQLQERVSALSDRIDTLKSSLSGKSDRRKELDELLRMVQFYADGKPVADKLAAIKWKGRREQFMSELGVGGNEDPALFIGEKEVSLGALADDLQLGVQSIQLGSLGQSRLLHDIIRRALGHIRHAVQRVVPLLGKIAAEQQPLRAAQHRRASTSRVATIEKKVTEILLRITDAPRTYSPRPRRS